MSLLQPYINESDLTPEQEAINELIVQQEKIIKAIKYLAQGLEPADSLFKKAMVKKVTEILS